MRRDFIDCLMRFALSCARGFVVALALLAGWDAFAEAMPSTVTNVYSETWIGPNTWRDVCPCETWDNLVRITANFGGGYMGSGTSTVAFEYADGKCTLKDAQNNSVARYDAYGNLVVQFEMFGGSAPSSYWVKCVVIKFKIEGNRLWAIGTAAPFKDGLQASERPYDFGSNPGGTPLSGSGEGYGVCKLTVVQLDRAKSLTILGSPADYGTVSPAYGLTYFHESGDTVGPFTAPQKWESDDKSQSATCTGWQRYVQDEYGGDWSLDAEGSGVATADAFAFPGKATRFVWQWQHDVVCKATAGTGGTVSPTSQSLSHGATFTATATPDEGYFFASWSGVEDARRHENPISVTVTGVVDLVATFLPNGTRAEWTGAGEDALASNPANWKDGVAPIPGIPVFLTGDKSMTWDLYYAVGSWTQDAGYTGTVTIPTVYEDSIEEGPKCLVILGDCTLEGGTWTHLANALKKTYRMNVKVGGDMTVGANALIHADGCGYQKCVAVDGYSATGTCGGAYGGHGGHSTGDSFTYGSYAAPEDPGNGGNWNGYALPAGGAIRLEVAGALTLNGTIRANSIRNGYDYYSGSGGGIYVIADSITGSGQLKANSYGNRCCGGGGRVAVKLTGDGSDFSHFDLVSQAQAIPGYGNVDSGSPGTVYGETKSDVPGEGWLVMRGNGTVSSTYETGYADPFTSLVTSLHFAKITVTNNAIIRVHSGCTLDLRETTVVATDVSGRTNGIRLNGGAVTFPSGAEAVDTVNFYFNCVTAPSFPGGTLKTASGAMLYLPSSVASTCLDDFVLEGGVAYVRNTFTVPGDVVVKSGAKLVVNVPMTVGGSMTVQSGGVVTQGGPAAIPSSCCDITTSGDFTLDEGGKVTAAGCGYSAKYSPVGYCSSASGSSHGGRGWSASPAGSDSTVVPYGSIIAPTTPGGGSYEKAGGGVVKLTVGGTFTVNGSIDADGLSASYYPAAGGSVNVTAARLAGSGTISADAPQQTGWSNGPSGGGRVAVALTAQDADFSNFPIDHITARGQSANYTGGAGTVLLRTASQGVDAGDLIVRNRGTSAANVTPVGGAVEGTSFRNVTILDNAKLRLEDGETMTVRGDWTNEASFVAGADATVAFAGVGVSRVYGDTTFTKLACSTPGKIVEFAAGSVLTVTGLVSVSGGSTDETFVTLRGQNGASWQLKCADAGAVLNGLALGNCTSDKALVIVNGKNLGGNSDNITFVTVTPGEEIVWSGASDSSWENAANWNLNRSPFQTDHVSVPATERSPTLGTEARVAQLAVAAGATLDLGQSRLTVDETADIQGTLSGSEGSVLNLSGTATLGGTLNLASSTVAIGGTATLASNLSCATFSASAGASLTVAAGRKLTASRFVVEGTSEAPVGLTGSAAWKLVVVESDVAYAHVANCDASEGLMIVSETSTDGGGNSNWLFTDTRVKWTGAVDTDFGTAGNWSGNAVPTETDDVCLGDSATVVLAAGTTVRVKTLTLGANATLSVKGTLSTVSSVAVAGGSTLEWNTAGSIGGNLVLLEGATLTHAKGGTYRLDLTVAGSGLLQAGSKVDVKGRGFRYGSGYNPGTSNCAGSHGGRGYCGNSAYSAYGSIVSPILCGSAGGNSTYSTHAGGGAASLVFGGVLTLDAEIDADGEDHTTYYGGAGGSIRIVARTLSGSGNLHANGNLTTGNERCGGGGRVSVVLTEGDFTNWTGTTVAYGGRQLTKTDGSAGTVFLKSAGTPGTLRIVNRADTARSAEADKTDFPSLRECDPDEVNGIDVVVGTYGTLYLMRNQEIRSLAIEGKSPRILLNGHTLTVTGNSRRLDRAAVEKVTTKGGGEIIWKRHGLVILIR